MRTSSVPKSPHGGMKMILSTNIAHEPPLNPADWLGRDVTTGRPGVLRVSAGRAEHRSKGRYFYSGIQGQIGPPPPEFRGALATSLDSCVASL